MTPNFKTIADALPVLRPGDKIERILNNKFAVVRSVFESGRFDTPCIVFLHCNTIYKYSQLDCVERVTRSYLSHPNTERHRICSDHSANGKPQHYHFTTLDYRRMKKTARQLQRVLL